LIICLIFAKKGALLTLLFLLIGIYKFYPIYSFVDIIK
jgi:type III secretory pathway component EscT